MTSAPRLPDAGASEDARARLARLVDGIDPWDDLERAHVAAAGEWIASGAPVYRTRKPDVPPMHLVSYFVVLDEVRRTLLLVAHRKAGLWLPTGGHVEPGEDPWAAAVRECGEELRILAVPSAIGDGRPFFLTVTRTRGAGEHTDVSLWYLLSADSSAVVLEDEDEEEFTAIRWLTVEQVLAEPLDSLDPHMHRFTGKLRCAWQGGGGAEGSDRGARFPSAAGPDEHKPRS